MNRKTYCRSDHCPVNVIGPFVNAIVSYSVAVAILAVPLTNALGADVKNIMSLSNIDSNSISFTAIGLALTILLSGWVSAHERHTHPLLCIIHSCGVPGVVLAIMTAVNP